MAEVCRSLNTITQRRVALTIVVAVCSGGCSLTETYEPPRSAPSQHAAGSAPALPQPTPLPQAPPPAASHPATRAERDIVLSPASSSLVKQAHAQIARGDLTSASTTLDRALRIEPNNPLLWVELGRLRLAEGDPHQAEVCAGKALALGSGSRSVQAQAGRLLADAHVAEGAASAQ